MLYITCMLDVQVAYVLNLHTYVLVLLLLPLLAPIRC